MYRMFSLHEYNKKLEEPIKQWITTVIHNSKVWLQGMISRVKKFDYKSAGVMVLMYYSVASVTIKKRGVQLYNNNLIVKDAVDTALYFCKYIVACFYYREIEPLQSNWICTSMLLSRDPYRYVGDKFSLIDSYDFMNTASVEHTNSHDFFIENYKDSYGCSASVMRGHKYIDEILLTMKIGDRYTHRICYTGGENKIPDDFFLPVVPLKYKLLSVEYTHPSTTKTIVLSLDNHVYYENNVILSSAFVFRALEHQNEPYLFDGDYILKIMDSNINTFVLKCNQYLVLEKTEYKIVTIGDNEGSPAPPPSMDE